MQRHYVWRWALCLTHETIPRLGPAIACVEATDHARARKLAPVDPLPPRPIRHAAVARIGPAIAGLFVAQDVPDPRLGNQRLQDINRRACPHQQWRTQTMRQ